MAKDVLHRMESGMPGFSKGKRRIAAYILENYDKAAFMTAGELGSLASVSESTVVRFAADLGYAGYPAMQKALQEMIRSRLTAFPPEKLTGSDLAAAALRSDMESLRSVLEKVRQKDFDTAAQILRQAKHIYILGVRASAFLAEYLHFYLRLIFEHVTLVSENSTGDVLEKILRITPEDVLVVISFPRYASAALKGAKFAHDRGAKVIAVTDSISSPLCALSQAAVLAGNGAISFVESPVAAFSLLNGLILSAGQEKSTDISRMLSSLEDVWEEYGVIGDFHENDI